MKHKKIAAAALITMTLTAVVSGVGASIADHDEQDLGTMGPVYEIAEPDFLDEMMAISKQRVESGEWLKSQEAASKKIIASIREPRPIEGITKTMVARTRYWDPTIVAEENIVDEKGRVLVPKGTAKNPLDVMTLDKSMLFIDGRDAGQVAMAKAVVEKMGEKVTPILVAGPVVSLMEKWKRPVYFDQHGLLTARFGIKQVPAWVYQEGKKMRIDEVIAPAQTGDGQ